MKSNRARAITSFLLGLLLSETILTDLGFAQTNSPSAAASSAPSSLWDRQINPAAVPADPATALADPRELGMLWAPIGITRAPIKLIVHGRLIRQETQR